jgi:hypothetical protein
MFLLRYNLFNVFFWGKLNYILALQRENILPLFLVIALVCFIPMCIFFTLNITSSMQRYSKQEDTHQHSSQLSLIMFFRYLSICITCRNVFLFTSNLHSDFILQNAGLKN